MGYLTANDLPGRHAGSWYAETAGELPAYPPLRGATRADVCVVGAGYAGLSAALHLAERGLRVVVLEANRVGWGASGRNGGQVGIGPRAEMGDYVRALGRADACKAWDIALAGNALVKDLVARHGIACDLAHGFIEAGWRPSDARAAQAWPEEAERDYGHPAIRPLSRTELREHLGTDRYFGGNYDGLGAHLHPLRFALGLARAAAAAGAVIHEGARVLRLERGAVETREGRVSAPEILLACNGYLDGLEPRVQARSMPINNFIIATEPLPADRAEGVIRGTPCVFDTKFVVNYFRKSPDNRILWGGGESYTQRFPRDIAGLVRAKMLEVYPQLADVAITHAWGGTLAITMSRMPAFQRPRPGLWSISGWSGSGIHMGTIGGQIAAEAIAGTLGRWDLMARLPAPAFPGGAWFRAPLLVAAMTWYALRDRL